MITKEEYKLMKELEERIESMEEIIERNQIVVEDFLSDLSSMLIINFKEGGY